MGSDKDMEIPDLYNYHHQLHNQFNVKDPSTHPQSFPLCQKDSEYKHCIKN